MLGFAVVLEGVDLQPAVVDRVAGGPDDGADPGLGQVELQDRLADTGRIGQQVAGFGLRWQVEAVAGDVGVCCIQQGQVVLVATGDVVGQVVREVHHATVEGFGQADQGHALLGEPTKVDGFTPAGPTHGNGHVLLARLHGLGIPFAQHPQPPAEITVAIGTRRPVVSPHRQVHLLAGALQFIGDLHTRGAGAHHQYRACSQLLRVAVLRRVDLLDAADGRCNRRDHRALERTGGDHHMPRFDHPGTGVDSEARTVGIALDALHVDPGADRCIEFFRIGFEVVRDLLLGGKGVRVQAGKFQARKAVVPRRAIGNQRIPAPGAPRFGDPVALQHQVRHPKLAQVLTHGHAGLTGTHNKRINLDFLNGHVCALLKVGRVQIGHGWRL